MFLPLKPHLPANSYFPFLISPSLFQNPLPPSQLHFTKLPKILHPFFTLPPLQKPTAPLSTSPHKTAKNSPSFLHPPARFKNPILTLNFTSQN